MVEDKGASDFLHPRNTARFTGVLSTRFIR
jgi:hypothetical protein